MDGPRPILPHEFPSLAILLDTVFRPGQEGEMFRIFPTFLTESNKDNILVFADADGTIVSHVGMTLRWASIEGCTVGTAAIGAVATYESHRGRRLASQLMDLACRRAQAWGTDFMMISGGRGLYRRIGAADVGENAAATLDPAAAESLRDRSYSMLPLSQADLEACASLYGAQATRYLRPLDDWKAHIDLKICMCKESDLWTVRRSGVICAYLVVHAEKQHSQLQILEFAGDAVALSASLPLLFDEYGAETLRLQLEPGDLSLRVLLEGAGADTEAVTTSGTMLLLDLPRLVQRLAPVFRVRLGRSYPDSLRVTAGPDGSFCFSLGGTEWTAPGRAEAAQFLFGHPQHPARPGDFARALPVSTVWYGLDYV